MDPDLWLVIGVGCLALALPSLISAFADSRAPRVAVLLALLGGGLVWLANDRAPVRYRVAELPDVVLRVIGRYLD